MIYLIGGSPRVGKSVLAKAVVEATGSELVATDDLCREAKARLPEDERHVKFPLSGFSGNPDENTLTPDEWVALQTTSAHSLEPEINALVKVAVQSGRMLVIEGVHLLPELVEKLVEKFGEKAVHAVFLLSGDAELVIGGMAKNTNPHDWLKGADAAVCHQVAEASAALGRWVKGAAAQKNLRCVERTDDFKRDITAATGMLLG